MTCPDENELVRFSAGALASADTSAIEAHLDGCGSCRRVVAAVALASAPAHATQRSQLEPGATLGRYRVENVLGSGAMGVVYAAQDTQLGRRVALKVIHPALPFDLAPEEARARILREAQSMAKLSHPNVVSVFDIGAHGEDLFVAMELSDGVTLDVWRNAARPTLKELVRVFGEAGAGLAAAHKAGIVHRDFKPQNVLIDNSGRVRVSDFGLSRHEAADAIVPMNIDAPLSATRTGLLLGTPGYMAPEQFDGKADARSDQFAFAVALFEACTGERPFRGDTLPELREGLRTQALPPRPKTMPAWLYTVLRRALSKDPAGRFSSMDELLRAIHSGVARRRRLTVATVVLFGAGFVSAVAAGIFELNRARHADALPARSVSFVSGEWRELSFPGLKRLAVADPEVVSVKSIGDDRVQLVAETPGKTTLIVWTAEGARTDVSVHVLPKHVEPLADDEGEVLRLGQDEKHVLSVGGVTRLAIGDGSIADVKVTPSGEIEVMGRSAGMTTLLIWLEDGSRRSVLLKVSERGAAPPATSN